MINDPAVLVVDEPTSGLDSSIALSVMQVLKDIAATGRTVIGELPTPVVVADISDDPPAALGHMEACR